MLFEKKMEQQEEDALDTIQEGITTVGGESIGNQEAKNSLQSEEEKGSSAETIPKKKHKHLTRSERMIIADQQYKSEE